MTISNPFFSSSRFYDDKNFPYGIARSGEFSRQQVELLENHGNAYIALASGSREAIDEEERDFIRVCQGEKEPSSDHEITWIRYCSKIKQAGPPSASLYVPTSRTIDTDSFDSDD